MTLAINTHSSFYAPWLMRLIPKIGVEIHAQLQTKFKLFSEARTDWKAPINSQVHLFDCGTPGTLPRLNWDCVRLALRAAQHTNCSIAPVLRFDRKHYEYWDLPAGYQITQKRLPIGLNGHIELFNGRIINLKQIHLEQDSGKSFTRNDGVIVDLNRAGVALIELVSQPEISSPSEAVNFVSLIHDLLQDLQTCSGNLEEGVMRIDLNVNLVCGETNKSMTPRVEIKNINGINVIEDVVSTELKRQEALLKSHPEELRQETRLYCPQTDSTVLLREKDSPESYRYLPEYDLPEYPLDDVNLLDCPESFMSRHDKIKRIQQSHPSLGNATNLLLRLWTRPTSLPALFEGTLPFVKDQRFLLNWCTGELLAILNREFADSIESIPFSNEKFAELVESVRCGRLDKEIAKMEMISALKESRDLIVNNTPVISDSINLQDLNKEIDSLFAEHRERVAFLQSSEGKQRGSVDFFIGPLMKKFRGRISAVDLKNILIKKLNKS